MRGSNSPEKSLGIDIGLAVLAALSEPGQCWTFQDIADVCGCHRNNIFLIYRNALKRLHNRRLFMRDPRVAELIEGLAPL